MLEGVKQFDVRQNDRDFQVGNHIELREYSPCGSCGGTGRLLILNDLKREECDCGPDHGSYSGQSFIKQIVYILQGGKFGIEKGFCVLGLKDVA